jgi:glycosyltransferase involved in cell wall biosynthesis
MQKLIILPGMCSSLGGTLVTLVLLLQGIRQWGRAADVVVLTMADSLMETYLRQAGYGDCLKLIVADTQVLFMKRALSWVQQQPAQDPLLLDNCVNRHLMPTLLTFTPALRLSGRPIYHFFHDLALSYNPWGFLARKILFSLVQPKALCNSRFTAGHVSRLVKQVDAILYQPVDLERFQPQTTITAPEVLQPLLRDRQRIILTPTRIRIDAALVNDKNLLTLIAVLAHLRQQGHGYHWVVIGEDRSQDGRCTRILSEQAEAAGVKHHFTILPPTFAIETYYPWADVVVTLAPNEPFGRTVVEAIACGIPVIGSKTGGIGEILSHFAPETWMVDPQDPAAAAAAILQVAADPLTPTVLAEGRQWVKTHCSSSDYAHHLMQIVGLQPMSPANLNRSEHPKTTC